MYLTLKELETKQDIQSYFDKMEDRLVIDCKKRLFNIFGTRNWLLKSDVESFLKLSNYDIISNLNDKIIAKKRVLKSKEYSVSIIIPARNEEKNITNIIKSFPNSVSIRIYLCRRRIN
jgi:hypothetical protein